VGVVVSGIPDSCARLFPIALLGCGTFCLLDRRGPKFKLE
jgi:hypothetical protein